jgi:hypothetical protein
MAKSKCVSLARITMKRACLKGIAAALAALSLTSAAFAQYMWLDERGVKQFSDRPPPSSVPVNRILRQPGGAAHSAGPATAPVALAAEAPASQNATAAKDKAPMTTAEKNADFLKRRAEQTEKDKKAEEQTQLAAEKAKNCERAGEYRRLLESGERIARTDHNGERYYLSDDQRSREINESKRLLQECK